jgi:glycogen synthase
VSGSERDDGASARPWVLRVCSVFEPPDAALTGRGVRFDPVGGMQNHTGQLTRALDRHGVRQSVVTHRPPGSPRRERIGERTTVHRFGLPVGRLRQLYWLRAGPAALRLARRADLVHAHLGEDLVVLPIALAAARSSRLPLVVTVHCSLRHTMRGTGVRALVLKQLGGLIETAICRRADAVIALTPRLAQCLEADGVARVHVIPSGVRATSLSDDPLDPFPGVGHPRIVYVGRLARSKGLHTLVDAAARLRTAGVQVLLVGDGPERRALERMLGSRGLGERVRITGFLPHRRIPAVLRHADLFCLPSEYEELGTAALEAMAAGLPIVASATGGIPGAVGPAGRLVPPGDPAALADALDALLSDESEAARLARMARERARELSWDRLVLRVLDVYRFALACRPRLRADVGGQSARGSGEHAVTAP